MAVNQRRIQVSIDSLSLVGMSRRDAARFEVALRSELTTLLSSSAEIRFVGGNSEQLSGNVAVGNAETMGRNVAQTIYRGIRNG